MRTSGREVDEWRLRPNGGENHWLDGLFGCCVAASMHGAVLLASGGPPRPRVWLSELQAQQRRGGHMREYLGRQYDAFDPKRE